MGSLERAAGSLRAVGLVHFSLYSSVLPALAYQIITKMIALKINSQANGKLLSTALH